MINYSDDQMTICSSWEEACHAYIFLVALLNDLGLPISVSKLEPPTLHLTGLGIEIDIDNRLLRIPGEKLQDIIQHCEAWRGKKSASKRKLQSLLGKLLYITKCVRPARLFLNRMHQQLRITPDQGNTILQPEF